MATHDPQAEVELFFAPLACSMATRVALYAAGLPARFTWVDLKRKRLPDGTDFHTVSPLGYVPALRLGSEEVLTENPAILQYVADLRPETGLAPEGGIGRYRLQQWLNLVGTELHKGVFTPLLNRDSPDGAKAFAQGKAGPVLAHLDRHLSARDHLLDGFSVADAYLATVLNWCGPAGLRLADWPAVQAYHRRIHAHPSFARAFTEERALYEEEQAAPKAG